MLRLRFSTCLSVSSLVSLSVLFQRIAPKSWMHFPLLKTQGKELTQPRTSFPGEMAGKHFLFRCFIKSVFLGCYCHSFQGVRAEKGNSAIALDGMLVFKLMRAKPQAITEKIQASLSPPTPPVTQHAPHCAKEGSSKH